MWVCAFMARLTSHVKAHIILQLKCIFKCRSVNGFGIYNVSTASSQPFSTDQLHEFQAIIINAHVIYIYIGWGPRDWFHTSSNYHLMHGRS
jgi:hypothetical protein